MRDCTETLKTITNGMSARGVTVRIKWRFLFTVSGGDIDRLFDGCESLFASDLQRCESSSQDPPLNSNRTRHLIRTKPAR